MAKVNGRSVGECTALDAGVAGILGCDLTRSMRCDPPQSHLAELLLNRASFLAIAAPIRVPVHTCRRR